MFHGRPGSGFALFLLLLAASAGCAPEAPLRMKVVTINVRHDADWWEERFPLIAQEIVRLEPDLIGLQEVEIRLDQSRVLLDMVAALSSSLRYEHDEEAKSGLAAITGEGIAIFSRHPIIARDARSLEYGRVVLFNRIQIGERIVDLYNTHLHHEGGDEVRRPQMEALVGFVEEKDAGHATFLTGDMNATPESETIQVARDAGFVDTFEAVHGASTASIGSTSPIRLAKEPTPQAPRARIDFIFARDGRETTVSATDAEIAFDQPDAQGLYPSDHLGIVTSVELSSAD